MNRQLSSILIILLAGMLLGVFFDLYRVLRGKIIGNKSRARVWAVNLIGDLCFWGLAFILVTPVIFWGTWLELRFYVWVTMLAGIGLYFGIFSSIFILWMLRFWRIFTWAPRKFSMIIGHLGILLKKVTWWFFIRHLRP